MPRNLPSSSLTCSVSLGESPLLVKPHSAPPRKLNSSPRPEKSAPWADRAAPGRPGVRDPATLPRPPGQPSAPPSPPPSGGPARPVPLRPEALQRARPDLASASAPRITEPRSAAAQESRGSLLTLLEAGSGDRGAGGLGFWGERSSKLPTSPRTPTWWKEPEARWGWGAGGGVSLNSALRPRSRAPPPAAEAPPRAPPPDAATCALRFPRRTLQPGRVHGVPRTPGSAHGAPRTPGPAVLPVSCVTISPH